MSSAVTYLENKSGANDVMATRCLVCDASYDIFIFWIISLIKMLIIQLEFCSFLAKNANSSEVFKDIILLV